MIAKRLRKTSLRGWYDIPTVAVGRVLNSGAERWTLRDGMSYIVEPNPETVDDFLESVSLPLMEAGKDYEDAEEMSLRALHAEKTLELLKHTVQLSNEYGSRLPKAKTQYGEVEIAVQRDYLEGIQAELEAMSALAVDSAEVALEALRAFCIRHSVYSDGGPKLSELLPPPV